MQPQEHANAPTASPAVTDGIAAPEPGVDSASQTLQELLRDRGSAASELPAFARSSPGEAKGWIDQLNDWIQSLLSALFPKRDAAVDLSSVLFALKWLAICAVVALVAYFVWLVLTRLEIVERKSKKTSSAGGADASFASPESALVTKLEEAIVAKRFAQAARLRWRLFLVRQRRVGSMTPYEYFSASGRGAIGIAAADAADAYAYAGTARHYTVMFAGAQATANDYEICAAELAKLESSARNETNAAKGSLP